MAGSKLTREEQILLQDFSRNVSTRSSALFYGNALLVSALPIWLYCRIHQMDPLDSAILFVLGTAVATWLVAFAYKNTKFVLKHKIAQKREDAIAKDVLKVMNDEKKIGKKEKDERILWKKNEVADYEATTFSIFYNNALYLALVCVSSFLLLANFAPSLNYVLSVTGSAGLIALFSTGTK